MKKIFYLTFLFASLIANHAKAEIDFSYEVHLDHADTVSWERFKSLPFKDNKDLNLGFYEGSIWIKAKLTSETLGGNYIVRTHDFINRNYHFYEVIPDSLIHIPPGTTNQGQSDDRYFNFREPNFRVDLNPNQTREFLIHIVNDGRVSNATPSVIPLDEFVFSMRRLTIFNVSFFGIVGALFLCNLLLAFIHANKTYFFYSMYILFNTFFMLGLDGSFFDIGFDNYLVDHLVFLSIRIWVIFFLAFSASFLSIHQSAPRFIRFTKRYVLLVMVGLSLYQLLFYSSSVAVLHRLENIIGFTWFILLGIGIYLSPREKKKERIGYLVFLGIYVGTTILSLSTSHGGNGLISLPNLYKIGCLIDFIGFTFFMIVFLGRRKKAESRAITELKTINHEMERGLEQSNERLSEMEAQMKALDERNDPANSPSTFGLTNQLAIFKLLEANIAREEDWVHFRDEYLRLDPQFLPKLVENSPNLTKSEIRLLTLVKIGYSQKEIAQMLAISPDSVKKARHRTRKKLGLSPDTSIGEYLKDL